MTDAMRVSAFAPETIADPVSAAHPRYLPGARYGAPYRWPHLRGTVRAASTSRSREPRRARHTAAPYQPGRATRSRCALQRRPEILHVYSGDSAATRFGRAYRRRPRPHGRRKTATPGFPLRNCPGGRGRPDRRGGALPRACDQPSHRHDDRPGWLRTSRAGPRRRGDAVMLARGLTGVSPDRESGRPSPRSQQASRP